jgi:hypothetical protein
VAAQVGERNRCALHDVSYGKLEQCSVCRAERAGGVKAGSPKADTSGPRTRAADYRLNQAACWDGYKTNLTDDPNVAVKFSAESGKWAGRADELEMRILEIEHDQWLIEQDRQRRGSH